MEGAVTRAEAIVVTMAAPLAATVVFGYLLGRAGLPVAGWALLPVTLASLALAGAWTWRRASGRASEAAAVAALTAGAFGVLLWRAWPLLLPPGAGPDLTHHLLLVDYIERTGRVVAAAGLEGHLGEMAHYTPGSHLLAIVAGAWTGRDGLHALYPVVALTVALKAGLLCTLTMRLLPDGVPRVPFGVLAVVLAATPAAYTLGSFTADSFVAQVVSELFAMGMWWALALWWARPAPAWASWLGAFGAAAFLTWPVWVGPPLLVFGAAVLRTPGMTWRGRATHLAAAVAPVLLVAIVHAIGQVAWVGIVRASGAVLAPSLRVYGWPFLVLFAAGLGLALVDRRARLAAWLLLAVVLQAAVLYVLATANGADRPYMALKMAFFAVYVQAALGALAVAWAWARTAALGLVVRRLAPVAAWAVVMLAVAAVLVPAARRAQGPYRPVVGDDLREAGRWASARFAPACVDYVVGHVDTAYWLHLVIMGNPRADARTADDATFEPRDQFARWIVREGLPVAVADLRVAPREVLATAEVLTRVGDAAVIARPAGVCEGVPVGRAASR